MRKVKKVTKYRIEIFDRGQNKYLGIWNGDTIERAEIMFNKPYIAKHTRRLIMCREEILYTERVKK